MPLGRRVGLHFLHADKVATLLLCDGVAVTFRLRVGILGSWRIPCAPGGQASTGFGVIPLNCLYYSTSCPGCQALFWTFFIVGSAPSIRAEVVRRHPTACAALCLLFITRVMGRPFKHRYQRCDFIGLTAHCCDLPPTHLRREALFTPRVCGVFLPLCDFSIPQSLDFVKHFFYFFLPPPYGSLT